MWKPRGSIGQEGGLSLGDLFGIPDFKNVCEGFLFQYVLICVCLF